MSDEVPGKIDYAQPISSETLFQLINGSIQSGKPLWLQGANLRGARLVHADLGGADLSGATLYKANLRWANLSGADLRRAKYNANTQWPYLFDPEAAGAVLVDD